VNKGDVTRAVPGDDGIDIAWQRDWARVHDWTSDPGGRTVDKAGRIRGTRHGVWRFASSLAGHLAAS